MYAIYGNIYHQYTPNVSIYIPYMDPMGIYIYIIQWDLSPTSEAGLPDCFRTWRLVSQRHPWVQCWFFVCSLSR